MDETYAVYCIKQGLTPKAVEEAVYYNQLEEVSGKFGLSPDSAEELAKRWGITYRQTAEVFQA